MASEKLNQAVAIIKAGNKQAALPLLKEAIQEDPQNEHAWLWLYFCVEEVEQKKFCLQKALQINPDNLRAHNALRKLTAPSQPVPQAAPVRTISPQSIARRKPTIRPDNRYSFFAMGVGLSVILCLALFTVYLAGTGQLSAVAAGLPLFPSPTLTPSLTPTVTATVTPSPVPTATETLTPLPSRFTSSTTGIAPLEELESYRMQGKMTMGGELDSASFAWMFTQEWVKASSAQRITMSIQDVAFASGPVASGPFPSTIMETIVIDRTAWMKYENDWIQIDSRQSLQQNSVPAPVADWQSLQLAGDEIINGIPCIHYIVDEDIMKVSGFDAYQDITTHALGDIWVANRPDLPPVILRMKIQMRVSGFLSSQLMVTSDPLMETMLQQSEDPAMVYSYEYDVTDVNSPIVIEPPKIPTVP